MERLNTILAKERNLQMLLWVIIILILLAIGLLYYEKNHPNVPEPVTFTELTVNKTTVHRGEEITYTIHGTKHLSYYADVIVELQNGENYYIFSYKGNIPVGPFNKSRTFIIPHAVKLGEYKINWTAIYHIDGHTISYAVRSPIINILAEDCK